MDKSKRNDRPYQQDDSEEVFPSDIFPEEVFPKDVFPTDVFPRKEQKQPPKK